MRVDRDAVDLDRGQGSPSAGDTFVHGNDILQWRNLDPLKVAQVVHLSAVHEDQMRWL